MQDSILAGILWGGGSALGFAFNQIINRRLVHQASVYRTTFLSLICSITIGFAFIPILWQPVTWEPRTLLGIFWFIVSGLIHFAVGSTVLGLSQRTIGAARSSPLTSSSVVVSVLWGALFFAEPFNLTLVSGILAILAGVYLISRHGTHGPTSTPRAWQGILFGLLAGACWATSPVFFRLGYAILPSTFIAVLATLFAGALVPGAIWFVNRNQDGHPQPTQGVRLLRQPEFWTLQLLAGMLNGAAVFARWISLVYLPIVGVNALNMLTIPTVVILAPLLLARGLESRGWTLWVGTACTLVGVALTLVGAI